MNYLAALCEGTEWWRAEAIYFKIGLAFRKNTFLKYEGLNELFLDAVLGRIVLKSKPSSNSFGCNIPTALYYCTRKSIVIRCKEPQAALDSSRCRWNNLYVELWDLVNGIILCAPTSFATHNRGCYGGRRSGPKDVDRANFDVGRNYIVPRLDQEHTVLKFST